MVGRDGEGLEGHAWLKNREVGEAIGEFFFSAEKNPFRGNELLLPKNWDDLAAEAGSQRRSRLRRRPKPAADRNNSAG